jgi:hypothetical protein
MERSMLFRQRRVRDAQLITATTTSGHYHPVLAFWLEIDFRSYLEALAEEARAMPV